MMSRVVIAVKQFFKLLTSTCTPFLVLSLTLFCLTACSDNEDIPEVVESFNVDFSSTNIELLTDSNNIIDFTLEQDAEFNLLAQVIAAPEHGTLAIDLSNRQIHFMVGEATGSGLFTVRFTSQTQTTDITINYIVSLDPNTTVPGDNDNCVDDSITDPTNSCDEVALNPYHILLPSNYITVFEDESIELEIKRNYDSNDEIQEAFYFNSVSIEGRLADDKNHLLIDAIIGEEDTYGEIIAVTQYKGIINETKMYVIYYNKNRDLSSTDTPVLATLERELTLTAGSSSNFVFDIYDPDSDRISYRVVKAPHWLTSHIHLVDDFIHLTLSAVAKFDPADTELVLELSDGHNVSQTQFTVSANDAEVNDAPPSIYIEQNVDLSLLVKLTGSESNLISTLTFAAKDDLEDNLEYTITPSANTFSYRLSPPYVYLYSDDVSALNHEQITLTASDGNYESKLTYHLYVKDNFLNFLGGHPNSAPMIVLESEVEVLETEGILVPYVLEDMEQHDITTTLEFDDSILQVIMHDNNLSITARNNDTDDAIITDVTLTATDAFGAASQATLSVTVKNNTPPVITYSSDILLIEGATMEVELDVVDLEDGVLPFDLNYDTNKFAIAVEDNQLFITALNVLEDFDGAIEVTATDSFLEQTTVSIPAFIRFSNSAPVITSATTEVTLLPGESINLSLTYVDPEADEVVIFNAVDNNNLTYSYDSDTQILTLAVDANADYEQEFTFSTSASDGFLSSFLNIEVTVPTIPTPPILNVAAYIQNVSEAAELIINYSVFDINGDNVDVRISKLFPTQLTIVEHEGYLAVSVPDNVLVDTPLNFDIIAQDDSANAFLVSETIILNVMPVNDPPEVTLTTNSITLINDEQTTLPMTVVDIDDTNLTVEVRTPTSAVVPGSITVHGADVNSIRISGASKGTVVNDLELLVRISDDETYTEVPFTVSVELVNEPPVFDDRVDLIQMNENATVTFNITPTDPDTATDGDVVSIVSVTSDDPTLLTIVGDPANPSLNTVTINSLDVSQRETVFVSITATDGYESVLKRVQVIIDPLP